MSELEDDSDKFHQPLPRIALPWRESTALMCASMSIAVDVYACFHIKTWAIAPLAIVLFTPAAIIGVAQLLAPASLYVDLTDRGLTVRLFGMARPHVDWTAVNKVWIGYFPGGQPPIKWNKAVYLSYSENGRQKTTCIPTWGYGVEAEELKALILKYREHAARLSSSAGDSVQGEADLRCESATTSQRTDI